jgi:hypothetical protein
MPNLRFHTMLFAFLFASGTSAYAETPLTQAVEQRVAHRQDRQEQRIDNGASSDALTAAEARRLGREQARVARAESLAEAAGKIILREAVALEKRQDVAGRRSYRHKHDAQTRP